VEAASQFQNIPQMHSAALAVLQASLAYGSKGVLHVFLFYKSLNNSSEKRKFYCVM